MHPVDLKEFIDQTPHEECLFEVQLPSESEMIEKWKPCLQCDWKGFQHTCFIDDRYAMIHAYMRKFMWEGPLVDVPPLEEADYAKASAMLETLEQVCDITGTEFFKKVYLIHRLRARMSQQPHIEKKPELTYEI